MFQRFLAGPLREAAAKMPVVALTGPRQSGKSTLATHVFPDHQHLVLEDPEVRAEAIQDPRGLLDRVGDGVILDEIQRVPELLSYIQVLVDKDKKRRRGRFILTGSNNLLLMQTVAQTLAGRTRILRLLPLSLAELEGRPAWDPASLSQVGSGSPRAARRGLWETVWTGMYPRVHDEGLEPTQWYADYQRTYVERDLRDVLRVMDLDTFQRFVRLAASRTGQELNYASLAADVGISQPTARAWLQALQIGFLVTILPPHHQNFGKRTRKAHRLHFLDTGLVCQLLGIRTPEMLERHPLRGAIFESFVVSELVKAFEHRGQEAPLFFWRDATGHEIDIVLDFGDHLLPVEVKSGSTIHDEALAGLRFWRTLGRNQRAPGVLVHGGTEARMREGFAVQPWFLR